MKFTLGGSDVPDPDALLKEITAKKAEMDRKRLQRCKRRKDVQFDSNPPGQLKLPQPGSQNTDLNVDESSEPTESATPALKGSELSAAFDISREQERGIASSDHKQKNGLDMPSVEDVKDGKLEEPPNNEHELRDLNIEQCLVQAGCRTSPNKRAFKWPVCSKYPSCPICSIEVYEVDKEEVSCFSPV